MSELKKLRWMCRRGMRELDVLLLGYLERHYTRSSLEAQQAFERVLELQDPDLHSLLLGRSSAEDRELSNVIAVLRQSVD